MEAKVILEVAGEAEVIMNVVVVVAEVVVVHSKILIIKGTTTTGFAMTTTIDNRILIPQTHIKPVLEEAEEVEVALLVLNQVNTQLQTLTKPSTITRTTVSISSSILSTERVIRTISFTLQSLFDCSSHGAISS